MNPITVHLITAALAAAYNLSLADHGYKALPNMQAALRDDVRAALVVSIRLDREGNAA